MRQLVLIHHGPDANLCVELQSRKTKEDVMGIDVVGENGEQFPISWQWRTLMADAVPEIDRQIWLGWEMGFFDAATTARLADQLQERVSPEALLLGEFVTFLRSSGGFRIY